MDGWMDGWMGVKPGRVTAWRNIIDVFVYLLITNKAFFKNKTTANDTFLYYKCWVKSVDKLIFRQV